MASESLQEATIKGARWLALTRVASEALTLAGVVVLARLISPAEFGRAAVALLFVPLGAILTFEGFASALVQWPKVTEDDRRSAMAMSLIGGILLTLFVLVLKWPLWEPVFGARTAGLIALMSPVLALGALGGVSRASVWRSLDFRRLSIIDGVSLLIGTVTSVTLAIAGLQGKALVVGALAQTATSSLLLMRVAPPPMPGWSRRSQREISRFGVPAALAGLVDVTWRYVDYAILAARIPAAQAGYYYRAFTVGVTYQDKISRVMIQIAFPLYSRTTDRDELRKLHERAARVHAAVIFPLLASLIVLAPELVPMVFGPAWKGAVQPTQILAVAGMIAAVLTGFPQIMLAIGRPRQLLVFNIAVVIGYSAAVLLASQHGLIVISLTIVATYFAILAGVYRFLLHRYVGISIRRLIPELGPAVVGCLAQIAATVPLRMLLGLVFPPALIILVVGLTGLVVYAVVLRVIFPAAWSDTYMLATRILPPLARIGRLRPPATAAAAAPPAPAQS